MRGSTNETQKPNFLLICADQFRWDYMGCAGADWMNTPTLDRLAARGVLFRTCVSNAPVCVPARVGLATGRLPACVGAVDNSYYLEPSLPTYYQRLRDAGYRVGCSGKLDLAKPDRYNGRDGKRPRTFQWGFTDPIEIEGKGHSLASPTPQGPYGWWLQEQGLYQQYHAERMSRKGSERWYMPSELPKETFLDVYQADRSVQWLEEMAEDYPWHFFVSFSGPHVPHDPPPEYVERYRDADIPAPVPAPAASAGGGSTPSEPLLIRRAQEAYCGYIELIDEQIGRILTALESRPDSDRTYIFFTSDHGELLGDRGLWAKSRPYESSMRVPLIASGPGIGEGEQTDAMVELMDLNPTICELAGLCPQTGIDAESFVGCLSDVGRPHRPDTVAALRRWWCLRTDRYKLIDRWNQPSELYDLREDPGEERNLIEQVERDRPELLRELHGRLNARFRSNPYAEHRT